MPTTVPRPEGADPDGRPADAVGPRVDANDDAWTLLDHGHPDAAVGDRDADGGRRQADEGRDAVGPRVDAVDAGVAAGAGRPDRAGPSSDAAELADGGGRNDGYGLGGGRVDAVDHTGADDPHRPVTGRKGQEAGSSAHVGVAGDDEVRPGLWMRKAGDGTRQVVPQVRRHHSCGGDGYGAHSRDRRTPPGLTAQPALQPRPRAG